MKPESITAGRNAAFSAAIAALNWFRVTVDSSNPRPSALPRKRLPPSHSTIQEPRNGTPRSTIETSTQITGLLHSFAGELEKTGCRVEKQIPDQTLHHESLLTYVGIFPYVIAQGTPWIIRKIIKMQLYRGLLKGLKNQYPDLKKSMNDAFRMNARHYTRMMLSRNRITRRWEEFFTEYDFLVCPVAFGPAFRRCKTGSKIHYDNKELLYLDYVWPFAACFNASGNPSLAVPLGLNEDGMPVGVQIVGRYWSEPELIHFVKLLQPFLPGFIRPRGFE